MLVCPNCNHKQEEGKFCGACGTALQPADGSPPAVETESEREAVPTESSIQEEGSNQPVHHEPVQEEVPSQSTQTEHVAAQVRPSTPAASQNVPPTNGGAPLAATHATNEGAATAETQTTPTAEVIKGGLSNYWNYFISLLKNTSKAFDLRDNNFSNGMSTILLYAVFFALSMYFMSNSAVSSIGSAFGSSVNVPFLAFFIPLLITFAILLLVALGCIFVLMKIGKAQDSFKRVITQFGAIIIPFLAINVIATLGGLLGSPAITGIAWTMSFLGVFIFIPVLFIYEKLRHATQHGLRIHLSLGYVILVTIITIVFLGALFQGIIDNIPTGPGLF